MMQKIPRFVRYVFVIPLYLLLLIKYIISCLFWEVFWPLELLWIIISHLWNPKKAVKKEGRERFPIIFLWQITLEKLKLREVSYSDSDVINQEQFD